MFSYLQFKNALPSIQRVCVPTTQKCSVITQILGDRIKQDVPSSIRDKTQLQREQPFRSCISNTTTKTCDSAIGSIHWKTHIGDMFRIVGKARTSFHLAVLESIYINMKKPLLHRQKEFTFTLGLHWYNFQ